jgi:hypothetical protein
MIIRDCSIGMHHIYVNYHSSDLIGRDGITFEIGEQYEDENEKELSYTSFVQYSNKEMLHMLNMNDFVDAEDTNKNNEIDNLSLYNISFEKLRTKMTNLTPDGKVNQIYF